MARSIMIQGTMSSAGKSLIAAGLCRVLWEDGLRVAPFKSQNMALNSFITRDGLEMGRAQVVQAQAAGVEPEARMNPVLLKPQSDTGSQVIVNGEVWGVMPAAEYYRRKPELVPHILGAYRSLAAEYDAVVLEGAGSPAEINLRENDIVNMGMARMASAPVLLVGDIDRGGVFASLYGTVALMEDWERAHLKGIIINKFRGDVALLRPGLAQIEALTGLPVVGVVPWLELDIDDEDSLSSRFGGSAGIPGGPEVAVVRFPRIANFTDLAPLEALPGVSVRYAASPRELGTPDLVVLPGTKSTIADLLWMRQNGLAAAVRRLAARGVPVLGICGGYQMLGRRISDPEGAEAAPGTELSGLGLLDMETVFRGDKVQTQTRGRFGEIEGLLSSLTGLSYEGYEIHMGRSREARPALTGKGNVYGTYIHGIFDAPNVADEVLKALCRRKGADFARLGAFDAASYRERQYDLLADAVRASLDMDLVYRSMGVGRR